MRIKTFIILFVLLTLGTLFLISESGARYLRLVGKFLEGNFNLDFLFPKGEGRINFELEVPKASIEGIGLSLKCAKGSMEGFNFLARVDGKEIKSEQIRTLTLISCFTGDAWIEKGKLKLKGNSESLKIDKTELKGPVELELELLAERFDLTNITQDIKLMAQGKLQVDGLKSLIELKGNSLEIEGFKGEIDYGKEVKLRGKAISLKLQGENVQVLIS